MKNTTFIYLFLLVLTAISIVLILFVILYHRYTHYTTKKVKKQTIQWENFMDTYMIQEKPLALNERQLTRKLKPTYQLISFLKAAESYIDHPDSEISQRFVSFFDSNQTIWINLAKFYMKKTLIHRAYFAHVCSKLPLYQANGQSELTNILLQYVKAPSIYCQENALNALYNFGNPEPVVEALTLLSKKNTNLHPKLITDGLLTFTGDKKQLVDALFANLHLFNLNYQVAVLNYFSFQGESIKDKLHYFLTDYTNHKDIICSVLRFYRKYPVQEYKPLILSWTNKEQISDWECISAAVSALASYPGDDTIDVLSKAIHSQHWYVRLNSARSLKELGVSKDTLRESLNWDDRYAVEQLNYQYNGEG